MTTAPHRPCPTCRVPLILSQRQGVGVDYCPQCSGVWLDRHEQGRILVLSTADRNSTVSACPSQPTLWQDEPPGGTHPTGPHRPFKARKSLLEDLFA